MATWDPLDPGVVVDRNDERVLVSHPAYPYLGEWNEAHGQDGLFAIAAHYVTALENPSSHAEPRIGLPPYWLADLQRQGGGRDERPYLLWLDLNPGGDFDRKKCDPRNSFWLERHKEDERPTRQNVVDRTAVLLACLFDSPDRNFPFMGGQGLRVVAHVGMRQAGGKYPVRITGLTSTLPRGFEKRFASIGFDFTPDDIKEIAGDVLTTFALSEHRVADFGISIKAPGKQAGDAADAETLILAKAVPSKDAKRDNYSYSLVAKWVRPQLLLPVSKRTLIAGVQAAGYVFDSDPMTKLGAAAYAPMRPHRPLAAFDAQRVHVQFPNLQPNQQGKYPLEDDNVIVTNSRYVDVKKGVPSGDAPFEIDPLVNATTRTDVSAAVNAYYHASQLFALLNLLGITPAAYFKFVPKKLWVRYRSGITPGPGKDGNTINAQVTITPAALPYFKGQFIALDTADARIEERLALADQHISPRRWPLGMACEPRWHWHEVSHVLLAAAVGELELRFAHSGGDGISAIYFDPASALATDPNWRGVTFPWVKLPARRHDRPVKAGWGWSGSLYQADRFYVSPGFCDKRTYWTEQILSSSLFRLYRAIGGDTVDGKGLPAAGARSAAAEHSLFLIIQAIAALGPAVVTPALTAEDFVAALIGVDAGTSKFGTRFGGMVRKVIRWAFQQQGLYQPANKTLPANEAGAPDKVDLHIESCRVQTDGTYTPIAFPGTQWQANANAMWNRKNDDGNPTDESARANKENHLRLAVRNLGTIAANNADAMLYWCRMPDATTVPAFDVTKWDASARVTKNVAAGAQQLYKLKWKPAGPGYYAVLAMASNADDRANIDPANALPCSQAGAAMDTAQLVAWDNNLALRVIQAA